MARIELTTFVAAPAERCFDLARSVDLHTRSTSATGERAVGGVTTGLLGLGQEVTWRARHFGVRQELTSRITAYDRPRHFRDSMVRGAFRRFDHDHFFEATSAGGTIVRDVFDFAAPLGFAGRLAERLFLTRYMRRFLEARNAELRAVAESAEWERHVGLLATMTLLSPVAARAQATDAFAASSEAEQWSTFDVSVQAGILPIQWSNGDPSGIAGALWSGRLAYRPPLRGPDAPRRLALELSVARAPGGGGEVPDPEVTMLGLALRESLRAIGGPGRVDPFFSAGVTWLRISPQLAPACLPPTCMREGAKTWRDGRFTLLALGGGVVMPLPTSLSAAGLRLDGRLHIPLGGSDEEVDSEGTWVELSAGVRLGF